jgi:hypothetical protein
LPIALRPATSLKMTRRFKLKVRDIFDSFADPVATGNFTQDDGASNEK